MTCECGQPLADFHDAFTRGLCAKCYGSWAADNAPWLSPGTYTTVTDLSWDLSHLTDESMTIRVEVTREVALKLTDPGDIALADDGAKAFVVCQVHWLRHLVNEALRLDRE